MKHGVPLSLLSAFPTGHDITCEEFEGALRDITKSYRQNGPWVPEGFSRVWRTEILRFAETAQNKPMVPRVEKWAILQ